MPQETVPYSYAQAGPRRLDRTGLVIYTGRLARRAAEEQGMAKHGVDPDAGAKEPTDAETAVTETADGTTTDAEAQSTAVEAEEAEQEEDEHGPQRIGSIFLYEG